MSQVWREYVMGMRLLVVALGAWAISAGAQEHELNRHLPSAAGPRLGGESVRRGTTRQPAPAELPQGRSHPGAVDPRPDGMYRRGSRRVNGCATGLVAAVTLDGGESWQQSTPAFSASWARKRRYVRTSDPWVKNRAGRNRVFIGPVGGAGERRAVGRHS